MTVLYGALLAVFAWALFAPVRAPDGVGVAALGVGASVGALLFLQPLWWGDVVVAWTWWVPISAGVAGAVLSAGAAHRGR